MGTDDLKVIKITRRVRRKYEINRFISRLLIINILTC